MTTILNRNVLLVTARRILQEDSMYSREMIDRLTDLAWQARKISYCCLYDLFAACHFVPYGRSAAEQIRRFHSALCERSVDCFKARQIEEQIKEIGV